MASDRVSPRLVLVGVLAALLLVTAVPVAFAATGEPTLGLEALQSKLDAAPDQSIPGYMKTVLRGSRIETIPLEVTSLTGVSPSSSLIFFTATGPKIDAIGGIASGMSGSPVYVEDDGVWKVIGAVSYGDYFTKGGTGLATPIDSMLQLVTDYSPRVEDLSRPVLVSGRLVDRVIVSAHPEKLSAASASGAFVARPLSSVFIGGLDPRSGAYKRLVAALAKGGVTVTRIDAPLSAGESSFSAELEPGAAVGALAARGDMWMGGIGTVTYADDDVVLAYGHPAYWTGETSLYMSNAWISGIWPSLYEPYKMGYPATIQGEFTQDRDAGIMGELGDPPAEAPITARVTNADTGEEEDSSVWLSSELLDSGMLGGAVAPAVSVAGYDLFDAYNIPGSANTTTTVVVSDGTDAHTVVMRNLFDSSSDIPGLMTEDADWAIYRLMSVLDEGVEDLHIVSVDLEATVTSERRNARIVGVNLLSPIHYGDNTARVSLLAYGMAATQTIDATVTIPEDGVLSGALVASCLDGDSDDGSEFLPDRPTSGRQTIEGVVDELNTTPAYNTLDVTFVPSSSGDIDDEPGGDEVASIETSASTGWFLSGSATAQVTEITADADRITYGEDAVIMGTIQGPSAPVEVSVYGLDADGDEEELVATGMSVWDDGYLIFEIPVEGLTASAVFRVACEASDGATPAETFVSVTVRGRIRLSATPKTAFRGSWVMFTASVAPRAASGTVRFQYYDKHAKKWRALITKRLTRTSTVARAVCWWRPARGTWKVRAIYGGNGNLAGATSPSVTIKVR